MKCEIYIDEELIGNVSFTIIDPTMGGITGNLVSNENYKKYQKQIQKHTSKKGFLILMISILKLSQKTKLN